jgi:hypothetical protein
MAFNIIEDADPGSTLIAMLTSLLFGGGVGSGGVYNQVISGDGPAEERGPALPARCMTCGMKAVDGGHFFLFFLPPMGRCN